MDDLPLKGSASDIFLPRLFGQLHRNRFEGVVRLALGQTAKVIYYRAGEIASAASNAESDRLAHLFISSGRLTREQLELARSRIPTGGSLGKTLIGMGLLTPAELLSGARDQVRQILNSCFLLTSGRYECEPGPLPREVTALGLPTRRLIFDALMQAHDRQWIVRQLGSMESVYAPDDALATGLDALGLDHALARVALYMDGSQSLRDLSSRTSLDDFTVSKLFLALEILGLCRLVGSPPRSDAVPGRRIEIIPEVAPAEPEPVLLDEPLESDPVSPLITPEAQETETPATIVEGLSAAVPAVDPAPPAMPGRADSPVPPPAEDHSAAVVAPKRTRRDDPGWQIDPETGERVAFGPVELRFDGKVSSEEERSSLRARWLGLTAAAVVIIGAALIYVMRNGDETGEAGPIASTAPSQASRSLEPPGPAEEPIGPGDAVGSPGRDAPADGEVSDGIETADSRQASDPATPAEDAVERVGTITALSQPTEAEPTGVGRDPIDDASRGPAEVPSRQSEVSGGGGAGVTAPAGRRATGAATVPEPPPTDPPRGSVSPFRSPSRYAAALKMLDKGDPDRAARVFQELVVAERPDRYTMQLMIACQPDTLRSIRAWSGDRGSLFIVPFSFKGRDCFRVCWGLYPTSGAASEARTTLPSAYRESGVTPIVVPIVRLRPPA